MTNVIYMSYTSQNSNSFWILDTLLWNITIPTSIKVKANLKVYALILMCNSPVTIQTLPPSSVSSYSCPSHVYVTIRCLRFQWMSFHVWYFRHQIKFWSNIKIKILFSLIKEGLQRDLLMPIFFPTPQKSVPLQAKSLKSANHWHGAFQGSKETDTVNVCINHTITNMYS